MSDKSMTWDEIVDEYFFSHNLRGATEISYRKVVSGFSRFIGEAVFPTQITHRDVLKWRRNLLKERNLSTHTWNNKVAHMRAIFNFSIERKLIEQDNNPFNDTVVQKEKKKKKTLTREQLTAIYLLMQRIEAEEPHATWGKRCALYPAWYWLTVLYTLRYTGMRQNQLLHIRLQDINLDEGYIELRLEGSKTHREWRVPAVRQLRARLASLLARAKLAGAEPSDILFDVTRFMKSRRHKDEYQYDEKRAQQTIRSFFNRLSRDCGFLVSAHRFRHTLATELMKTPERNLLLVKDLLGHRNVSTTMEYVELNMEIVGRTLEKELALHTDIYAQPVLHDLTVM
ncbi:tyrosine-type recombinase/integrase [Pectobacterium versatile]|uniref:tyrosine-type recombinase/integrase n=1 Tax=Pectobacterium versatile TaxID=2488639 RepID=UPI001CC9D294|nr:site-specific integrase [Pectobacterium versatile]